MPIYCYTGKDGSTVERMFPAGKAPRRVRLDDGKFALRDIGAEHRGMRSGTPGYPFECWALGVLPKQVGAAVAQSVRLGVQTDFNPHTGNPIIRDPVHYKKFRRALGFQQSNSYTD